MKFRITTTDHAIEATSLEDAIRKFTGALSTIARAVSEKPELKKIEVRVDPKDENSGSLAVEPAED